MHLVRKTVDAAMGISFRPEQGKRITSTELAGFYGIGTFEREPWKFHARRNFRDETRRVLSVLQRWSKGMKRIGERGTQKGIMIFRLRDYGLPFAYALIVTR